MTDSFDTEILVSQLCGWALSCDPQTTNMQFNSAEIKHKSQIELIEMCNMQLSDCRIIRTQLLTIHAIN